MTTKTTKGDKPSKERKSVQDFATPTASENDCKVCSGTGYISMGTTKDFKRPCVCTLRYLYRHSLGDEIYNAKPLKSSPFEDRTDQSLFIKANRRDFLPHLRHALICQGTNFFHRVTNDSQMLDAWLSKDKETSKDSGSTQVTFTSLRDLVEDPSLVVVFLGVTSYSNRALPGVLLESLRIRRFAGAPTWVVTAHNKPYVEGHFAWSPEASDYLTENFETLSIEATQPARSLYKGVAPIVKGTSDEPKTPKEARAAAKARRKKLSMNIL